ncbi:maleylpyruvate isomerase N-terminal domain-containing protein [Streptomyces sp. NBC_01808]|uniref:maleylpyruvate isomerase N-terminal domain-containing protein n=1 Tax=Streptomyces sp. NBC_01808 TaxID=2975947 RepID=UPI002DD9C3D6|nr:maleylpyruvate isomerase N-terminal domain-containing protein [Streptomyces sp. NBC_01808]WSA37515.1 maleylpyruvate isomerase N-terminal domain-containing protein [Streptomyces sp. NBC_01808]
MRLPYERYCAEAGAQTDLLRRTVRGADLATRVPTCPDWDLGELAVHVGGAHRWAAELVRTRATEELAEETVPGYTGPGPRTAAALDDWLAEGADLLAAELRAAGADAAVWSWAEEQRAAFWARRMAHETVVHRADADGAAGVEFAVDADVAADAIDEWLEILEFAQRGGDPDLEPLYAPELAGSGIHLHATDTPPEAGAEWLIELGPDGFRWRREHAKAAVALRGPLADVLRVFYRRLPPDSGRVEVLGEAGVLDTWLAATAWG